MAHHEQGVIESFNHFFRHQASLNGYNVRSFPLDGQDALVGADYLLSDESRFSLVEFKYTNIQIIDESRKDLRLKLCKALEQNPAMKSFHDQCHFIAWKENITSRIRCNVYRHEVCNQKVFGADSGLKKYSQNKDSRIFVNQFSDEFFSCRPPRSISINDFEIYLEWLLKLSDKVSKNSLELLTYDDSSNLGMTIEFSSVRKAYEWMQSNRASS